jgi:hypothetical protein
LVSGLAMVEEFQEPWGSTSQEGWEDDTDKEKYYACYSAGMR